MGIMRHVGLVLSALAMMCAATWAQQGERTTPLPEQDPEPENTVRIVQELRGVHPRLLFTPQDVPALRQLARGEGRLFFQQMEEYLNVCRAPEEKKFLSDDTDAQRHGLWRMPTAAIHYVLTEERDSFERSVGYLRMLLELEHWEEGSETNSGMGAANMLIGAAITFDCLYDDLEHEFRDRFRSKLLTQARRMYYLGHLHRDGGSGYWKQDPQNNHRWHRNAGLALAVLAVADEGAGDDDWLLARTLEELTFVSRWLPEDGTSHEGPSYMVFGGGHLVLAFDAADRCLGTDFLADPFFEETVSFRLQTVAPGFDDVFCYGDCAGFGGYSNYLFRCLSEHRLGDHLDGVLRLMESQPDAFWLGWWSLVWYDATVTRGAIENLPKAKLFPDLGLGFVRDGWRESDVGVMLKCGPYGGYLLQEYRRQHDHTYINIAHDDPDANSFLLYADGAMLADYDPYGQPKRTRSHNTILVNGKGQRHRGEGWTQPISDMTNMASITTWKVAERAIVVEGEAGNAYDDLSRYRRSLVWVPGSYILLLDDIRAHEEAQITWLIQSEGTEVLDEESGHYRLSSGDSVCEFKMASSADCTARIGESTANHKGRRVGYRQLQVKTRTDRWRVATVFDAWKRGDLEIELVHRGPDEMVVTVNGPELSDTWRWRSALDTETPANLEGKRDDRSIIVVSPEDRPGPP